MEADAMTLAHDDKAIEYLARRIEAHETRAEELLEAIPVGDIDDRAGDATATIAYAHVELAAHYLRRYEVARRESAK